MSPSRLSFEKWPAALYAIGDAHGCREQLVALEKLIVADARAYAGEKWLVLLGDLIDRGPDSAGVIAHALEPPPTGFRRICLRGNHEQMMLDFLDAPEANDNWLIEGGRETLRSYGLHDRRWWRGARALAKRATAEIPDSHLSFVRDLPFMLTLPGWVFVHAGLRPGVPLDAQDDHDLIWIREPFLSGPAIAGLTVVHGHTPSPEPDVTEARYGIDTGCCVTGRLTALRVTPDGATKPLKVGP